MSIYVQITNRCNMTCAHCCFNCTDEGNDMSMETFKKALQLAIDYDKDITIGGGEPTLHPNFEQFMKDAIWELSNFFSNNCSPGIHIVTNGSNTKLSIKLAQLAKQGVISAAVSNDDYHDPIDMEVIEAFRFKSTGSNRDEWDLRHINGNYDFVIPVGRAEKWGKHPFAKCVCDSLFINPLGDFYPCGCQITKVGNIHTDYIDNVYWEGYCEKSEEYKNNLKEYGNV